MRSRLGKSRSMRRAVIGRACPRFLPLGLVLVAVSVGLSCGTTAPTGEPSLEETRIALSVQATSYALQEAALTQQAHLEVTEEPEGPIVPSGTQASYGGVSLVFDPALAGGIRGETVPEDLTSDYFNTPEFTLLSFEDYILSDTYLEPEIMVFPVARYGEVNPSAVDTMSELVDLLATMDAEGLEAIPVLPIWNAGQMMWSNLSFVDFKNGSGVRFLTQYGQDVGPINNQGLFYSFQGLTHDSQYYVSTIFPVSHPSLPADWETIPGGDYQAFEESFVEYLEGIEEHLSAQLAGSFTPDLDDLDAVIHSIEIR